jgi:hypothetical protein
MRTFAGMVAAALVALVASQALAELGSNNPPDDQLLIQREQEAGCNTSTTPPTCPSNPANLFDSGIFDVGIPGPTQTYQPAARIKRNNFGMVGPFMLSTGLRLQDLDNLVYPGTSASDKAQLLEGMVFFTVFHTPGEGGAPNENGIGPINNQPACIGCHLNAANALPSKGLLQGQGCTSSTSNCSNVSDVTRAARSTLTNFAFTSLNLTTGGGNAPDNLDPINNTGKTAAFTTFGNFTTSLTDNGGGPAGTPLPGSIGCFDPLDGASHSCSGQALPVQRFGGFVQHHRPAVDACYPKPLPPLGFDADLNGNNDGTNPNGFKRSVGERAGPPYIGRGLMEAVPTDDILFFSGNQTAENGKSRLAVDKDLHCTGGCISGKANMIPRTFTVHTATTDLQNGTNTGFVGGVGRFGLRANGVEIMQFAVGGLQGELSFTSLFNGGEIVFPTLFPDGTSETPEPAACYAALSQTFGQPYVTPQPINLASLEVHLSEPFSERNFIRNTALPEFGDALIDVLRATLDNKPWQVQPVAWHPGNGGNVSWAADSKQAKVKRGAELFGIDLAAFAKRTIGGSMAAENSLKDNAIADDRQLNCVGCHTPIRRTGQSPAALTTAGVGAANLSYKWAPIFSDQLLHNMPVIAGERETTNGLPRDVVVVARWDSPHLAQKDGGDPGYGKVGKSIFDTLDLPRNLADDTFSNLKALAEGREFRTAPLMGIGKIGPPFLHDARVYLSKDTVDTTPAGTVTTNGRQTNAPLVVRSVDDALLAAIELHDLPPPDDSKTTKAPGAGCPVPKETTNVTETAADICPAYGGAISRTNRSDAAEVIYRFRQLSNDDQQAVIEFLKQL